MRRRREAAVGRLGVGPDRVTEGACLRWGGGADSRAACLSQGGRQRIYYRGYHCGTLSHAKVGVPSIVPSGIFGRDNSGPRQEQRLQVLTHNQAVMTLSLAASSARCISLFAAFWAQKAGRAAFLSFWLQKELETHPGL